MKNRDNLYICIRHRCAAQIRQTPH